jgi:hypothetical protein
MTDDKVKLGDHVGARRRVKIGDGVRGNLLVGPITYMDDETFDITVTVGEKVYIHTKVLSEWKFQFLWDADGIDSDGINIDTYQTIINKRLKRIDYENISKTI